MMKNKKTPINPDSNQGAKRSSQNYVHKFTKRENGKLVSYDLQPLAEMLSYRCSIMFVSIAIKRGIEALIKYNQEKDPGSHIINQNDFWDIHHLNALLEATEKVFDTRVEEDEIK